MAQTHPPESSPAASTMPFRRVVLPAGVLVLFFLSLVTWAFASPVGSSPDEDLHIANIYCLADPGTCRSDDVAWPFGAPWWALDPQDRDPEQFAAVRATYPDLWQYETPRKFPCYVTNGTAGYAPDIAVPADCLEAETQFLDRPQSLDRLDYYPSWVYRMLAPATQETVAASVAVWRVMLCLLTVVFAGLSVYLSPRVWRRPVAVGWLVCSVPLGMFLLSSINPSALAIVGAASAVGPAMALAGTGLSRMAVVARVGFLICCALLLLAGRTEGLAVLAGVAAALLVLTMTWTRRFAIVAGGLGVVVVLAIAIAATGRLGESLRTNILGPIQSVGPTAVWDSLMQVPRILTPFTTNLGWLDITLPPLVTVPAAFAFFGSLMIGLGASSRRKWAALAVLGVLAIGAAVALEASSGQGLVVRYYLPWIYALVIIALSPGARAATWTRAQSSAVLIALTVANSVALLFLTVRYVSGIRWGTTSPWALATVDAPNWWWSLWLGPFPNWLVGSLLFAGAVMGLSVFLDRDPSSESRPAPRSAAHPAISPAEPPGRSVPAP